MDTTTVQPEPALSPTAIQVKAPAAAPPTPNRAAARKPRPLPLQILDFVSSLRVTVVLFVLAMVLVFYGTWAQKDMSNFAVVTKYFRSFGVLVPFRVLTFFLLPEDAAANNWVVPFPGGWTIGTLLFLNMSMAFTVRLSRLIWGPGSVAAKAQSFFKKSGVYILHFGIILMMAGEVITGVFANEGILQVSEHETVNYLLHPGETELAFTDVTDPKRKNDDIVVVHESALVRGGAMSDKELPFDLVVVKFFRNADLLRRKEGDPPALADTEGDKEINVVEKPPVDGANQEKESDFSSVVVELKDKRTGRSLGTHLYSMLLKDKKIEHDGKTYEVSLRPRRDYRPYFVRLNKAEQVNQPNMKMAKDFSSWIQLIVPDSKIDRQEHIYMNAPLRYAGETFFQANMHRDPATGVYTTGLQVVRNPGWILPYCSCFFVALGMLIHFGMHLVGFLRVA
jgi:ResB-like family